MPPFAYLDPGTGSLLFQIGQIALTAFVSAIIFLFRPLQYYYGRILGKLRSGGRSQPASVESQPDAEKDYSDSLKTPAT